MSSANYDIVVVGAGAAGLTAAIGLARAGFAVAVVEAAAFPGAENWSGCVYFCENLAHSDILGPEGVEALAWERRLVERGFFACDGQSLLGMTYRDPDAFRPCYTVLRPIYDHHLAEVAVRAGVALLNHTTAESLIRDGGRVIGIGTQRGPLYADLVFLAEGDASHLVTREGYERYTDRREAPKFLQGIKEVIELPPGAIEETFGVEAKEGVAYEILLRNGILRGRSAHLNMAGFLYTNRQSLSVGLVLPAENLHEHFEGDPNLLIEWFETLPALQPWLCQGKRGVFGAKIIRGGGAKDIPNLIDEGLAIGGAASAIGVDFPYPNFTGPATAMGLLITRAACHIRAEGGRFTVDALRRHYLEPLERTHYWQDVEFLRRWPGYVKRTQVFFDRNLDLLLGTAYIWSRPKRWLLTKWMNWVRLLLDVTGPGQWRAIRTDLRYLTRALRLREVMSRPSLGRLLLDGTMNALRDLARRPRANLPPAGTIRLHYQVAGDDGKTALPRATQRWFNRLAPVLASAARRVYANDSTPLSVKLPWASRLLLRQVNVLDLFSLIVVLIAAGISGLVLTACGRSLNLFRRHRPDQPRGRLYPRYVSATRQALEVTRAETPARQSWDDRLAQLAYQTAKGSHIHVLWPKSLPNKNRITQEGLWHVCPARVYEARQSPLGQLQVIVNFENCIKCETCWRTSDLVDWGRDGQQRFVYPVHSPVITRLLDAVHGAGSARPALPHTLDYWQPLVHSLRERLRAAPVATRDGQGSGELSEIYSLLSKLERKLEEFATALAREPRTVDRARAEYLEMLARYAQQLGLRILEIVRGSTLADSPYSGVVATHHKLLELANAMVAKAEERARRTWDQRFAWAAADGRQLRQHHIVGLRHLLDLLSPSSSPRSPEREACEGESDDPTQFWLGPTEMKSALAEKLAAWTTALDRVFSPTAWREIDRQEPLSSAQDAVLRDLIAQVPPLQTSGPARPLHPPERKALLAELGRRDPSLAFRVVSHLWARDLAALPTGSPALSQAAARWARGEEWACFAAVDAVQTRATSWMGEANFAAARGAGSLLLLLGNQLVVVPANAPRLELEPLATLGLRGAGLARIRLDNFTPPDTRVAVDPDRIQRVWQVLSAADLTSIAFGMADLLCRRAVAHATSRVQFPGLFHDEEARDTIGKFGAVKKMAAEMAARRYLIETLDLTLSPSDFSSASVERAGLVKALAAEALGTAPGSLAYNAGQIFGGTGYSEDDLLAKYYRDGAAWRFLGPANVGVYLQHGEQLLRNWLPDGRRLATVPHEAQLFDQVAQRKALQGELDEVRVLRSRLRGLVNDWQNAVKASSPSARAAAAENLLRDEAAVDELTERLARQDAHLLAGKALLLRTHSLLEHGMDAEVETALLRVWFQEAAVSLDQFESFLRQRLEAGPRFSERPLVDPSAGPPITTYAAYLAAPCPYQFGDFLIQPIDLAQPRLIPELIEIDPKLAECDREYRELFSSHFGRPHSEKTGLSPVSDRGLPYERYIEQQHRPDPEDLDFCRRHGFFRMPIPADLGGEGRQKVEYALLTSNAQRLADVAISLTIQANTSIGTTPILLSRDKDLPEARKSLEHFLTNTALQREIQVRLEKLLRLLSSGHSHRVEPAVGELQKRLDATVLARTVLRTLAHRFLQSWQQAARSGWMLDPVTAQARLKEAIEHWKDACRSAKEQYEELGRRLEACDLYLRWIASGQISAFALTEPSAGSDTARVATRARLRSVEVVKEPDGLFSFVPAGAHETRSLLDARRLEFRPDGVYYRWSDTEEPARISFDEYDYETDDPAQMRYYEHGGQRAYFCDIGQLRERDGKLWYDYWELSGAKMWITNARIAGVFCLYAKTEEGVTGFLVDRHAEGLIVGKDEAKMGQLGSPTNELALQRVRVPRENVLGLEGRGQVNALETLNVGRAGLAVSAMAQMSGLIERARAFAQTSDGTIPNWAAWRLQRMEEDRFTAEALALEIVGRFDHPQTSSVRMESAIVKMLVSEMLHGMIEWTEDIYGLESQTQHHLVEKRKRDARILNIYEGTNEIQRFFILKDLATEVAPRWLRGGTPQLPNYLGREALELEALKAEVRQRVSAALEVFDQEIWQNPNLQANCFLLAEATAWLKAADSALARLAWIDRQAQADDNAEPSPQLGLGRRAVARCSTEVRNRLSRFDEELAHLRRGFYAPEIRAASLLFDRTARTAPAPRLASHITVPGSILVIVEPSAAAIPQPRVAGGRLLEPYLTLSEADRSALETALQLREQATAAVTITVAAVGSKGFAPVLREALSLGADRVRLVTSADPVTPDNAADALAAVLGENPSFDLILGGSGEAGNQDGLLARLTAEALGVPHCGNASQLKIQKTPGEGEVLLYDAGGRQQRVRPLPAAVAIEASLPLRPFTIAGYLAGLAKAVEIERWPKKLPLRPVLLLQATRSAQTAAESQEPPHPLTPRDAARLMRDQIGLGSGSMAAARATIFNGTLQDVPSPTISEGGVVVVLCADSEGRLQPTAEPALRAAHLLADYEKAPLSVLLLASSSEETQRRALSQVLQWTSSPVILLAAGGEDYPPELNSLLVREAWTSLAITPRAVVGEPWTEEAFAALSRRGQAKGVAALRTRHVLLEEHGIALESSQARGKLVVRQLPTEAPDLTYWIALAAEAEVSGKLSPSPGSTPQIYRWSPRLERFCGRGEIDRLLGELKQETGLARLADADVILDVGFGVGNRDGYEAVTEPLERALRDLGVRSLVIGGSRKVTEELRLLPADRQIGQSGVSVNPRLLLAIGISGAPQHLNYIGSRATIVAFNRDPEAPIMTLNQRRAQPRVFPVIGDLFETVPAFTAALREGA
jgi:alkylation response protein AidB-like acyl-CoA dehydrogenase/flavin-dependent dehydrogenase/electron transfer flavoprotein alpha subunit/ferredoxin-like protein FixX